MDWMGFLGVEFHVEERGDGLDRTFLEAVRREGSSGGRSEMSGEEEEKDVVVGASFGESLERGAVGREEIQEGESDE